MDFVLVVAVERVRGRGRKDTGSVIVDSDLILYCVVGVLIVVRVNRAKPRCSLFNETTVR